MEGKIKKIVRFSIYGTMALIISVFYVNSKNTTEEYSQVRPPNLSLIQTANADISSGDDSYSGDDDDDDDDDDDGP